MITGYKWLKIERDSIKDRYLKQENKNLELINKLISSLKRAKDDYSDIKSLYEWVNICGDNTMKHRCIHELQNIRNERNEEYSYKSDNLILHNSFNQDETLNGSGTFSENKNDIITSKKNTKNDTEKKNILTGDCYTVTKNFDSNI